MEKYSIYIMSALYIIAGFNHFIRPKIYLRMMPPSLPNHPLLNYLSGAAEIILGACLLAPNLQSMAAWGIIILLILIFPANVYMLTSGKFNKIPKWILWARLPLQLVLIWWAFSFTY